VGTLEVTQAMMFKNRRHYIGDIDTAEQLAEKLTQHSWTLCTGFRYAGFLFLNDSTGEDGAQEYAIVRETDRMQVESITFGWCDQARGLEHIRRLEAGTLGADPACYFGTQELRAHPAGSCRLCA
jgi:hypothetical protein